MKRILVCLLCLLLAVSAAACGGASSGESSGGISPPPETSAGAESADAADVSVVSEVSSESDASDDSDVSDELSARDDVSAAAQKSTPSERYDAMTARMMEGNLYFAIRGSVLDSEIEVAVAERGGVTSMRQTVGDESAYTVVKGDVAYVFDMLSPYYMRVSTAELGMSAGDNTRFVAEGREAIDGKTYDFVIRESLEDSSQHLTYFFDGDTLFAIRATVRMDSVTMNVLFRVTAFTDEIPEDMPFEVPQGYTEYVEEPYEAPEFPSELPEFTVGTLYSVSTSAAQCGFVYIFTERTDCDAYIEALKADGFRPVAWKESGVFAASRDGILVTVSYAAGATVIACIRPSDVFLDERAGFPNVLPAFTAGTLYLAGTEDDAAIFGYLQTTQADYDAYIRLLTEAGFVRQEDEEEENLFTAVNDAGIVVIVYHLHGVTTVCCMTAQSSL